MTDNPRAQAKQPAKIAEPTAVDHAPRKYRLHWLWRIFIVFGFAYLAVVVMFASLQRQLIYVPDRNPPLVTETGRLQSLIENIVVTADDGIELHGWLVKPNPEVASRNCCVLVFPGNGGHRGHRLPILTQLSDLGCHALICDYRGYAENAGLPTEEDIARDAHTIWRAAQAQLNLPPERIGICGQSLGGGVAVRLTAELSDANTPPAALILRATFTSLVDAGKHNYPWLPVRAVLVDRYPSIDRISRVKSPLLSIHGRLDTIVPFWQGEKLFAAAPATSTSGVPKRFLDLPDAGHNDIMYVAPTLVRQAMLELFDAILPAEIHTADEIHDSK